MNFINLNGKLQSDDHPALLVANRGYRYGDGLFETIKVVNGKILLGQYHMDRLFSGLLLLKIEILKRFTAENITGEILNLCEKNECGQRARVRLSVSRGNGGLYDENRALQYVIECWPLGETAGTMNENGLIIDIYPGAGKSCDVFSNLKSANFLPYTMAAIYAKENKLNDCLVLNTRGNIADSTIANVFMIKDGIIITPALNEGCINGVMRRYLLEKLTGAGHRIVETFVSVPDLENADEIFLTNAINGIRWVQQLGNKRYANKITAGIYNQLIKKITG